MLLTKIFQHTKPALSTWPAWPAWFARAPWVAVACALILAAGVVLFELRKVRRESAMVEQVLLEKGKALITAFESALQTGKDFHWTEEELRFLVRKTAAPDDVRVLALVDEQGKAVLAHPAEMTGENLLPSVDGHKEYAGPTPTENGHVFRIYRTMHVQTARRSGRHGHGGNGNLWRSASPATTLKLLVDYDLTAWETARAEDRTHMVVMGSILAFLAALGALTCHLLRAYERSRRMEQATAAFTQEILRTLPAGVMAVDSTGRIMASNPEALRIANLRSEQVQGQPLAEVLPPLWEALRDALQQGRTVAEQELRCELGAGRSLPLALSASPLSGSKGEGKGSVLIMRDLGELRHLQAELRRRDRLAALGTLAAGIAHEVRNPLSAIKGFARYFEECHPKNSPDGDIAATLGQEVLRLDKVVGDLLDFARPDSVQRQPVLLADLVERARCMAAPALKAHKVSFRADLPPLTVLVDGDGLAQVLINLFLNAAEAMRTSPPLQRSLEVTASVACGTDLSMEVRDRGTGIDEDHVHQIFSPYFTTKAKGTGLGLSIVHKIVVAHDGGIEAANHREGGCVFTLRLPGVVKGGMA